MAELSLVRDLILVLVAAFSGGLIAKILRFPLIVGYLVGGIVFGNLAASLIPQGEAIKNVAEMGVALLLFTLGLEFSVTKIKEMGEIIISASLIQVLLTILVSIIIFPFLGMDFYTSLFLGTVFSLSSTVVAVKMLSDRGELETLHGEIAEGWLFMQDLYTLPIIILLPTIAHLIRGEAVNASPFVGFARSIILAVISFFLILYLGKKVMPKIMEKIADFKSRELVLISAVCICLLFAYLFRILGFSFALGSFVAGVLLSSSSVNYGIFAEVRPLRDLFSAVFFVSLGFLLNLSFLLSSWQLILFLAILVIVIKLLISGGLIFILGYHSKTATLVGFSLISVGEFAFILALLGVTNNLISQDMYMTILSVTFLTLILSVPLMSYSHEIYYQMNKFIKINFPFISMFINNLDKIKIPEIGNITDHVVVLGHGRVGKYISRVLTLSNIPYIVVDYNHHLVKNLKREGVKVIYGDPAEIDVLRFAQVGQARAVILAYADRYTQETVVANILTINPNVRLICRTHFETDQRTLRNLGANVVVQPEFEAAVSMIRNLLLFFGKKNEEIENHLWVIRKEHGWY